MTRSGAIETPNGNYRATVVRVLRLDGSNSVDVQIECKTERDWDTLSVIGLPLRDWTAIVALVQELLEGNSWEFC